MAKNQGFRKGVGGRGLATNSAQNTAKILPWKCVLLLIRGRRKKAAEKGPESMVWEGFPCANPLCPPTPFRNLCKNSFSLQNSFANGRLRQNSLAFRMQWCGLDHGALSPFLRERNSGNRRFARPISSPSKSFPVETWVQTDPVRKSVFGF